MTPLQVATRVGAAVEDVEAELGLLTLDVEMQQSLREDRLSPGQAQVLLDAPDEETRRELWEYALRYRPTPERMQFRLERLIEGEPLSEDGEEVDTGSR